MGSILWVIQKGSILWVIFSKQKRSNSLSHIFQKKSLRHNFWKKKKLQVCESLKKKKGPILWIKFQKHKFQVSASGTILWVMRKINSLRIFSKKKNQFFKSNENMSHMQKKVFDSLSRIEKKRFDSLTLNRIYLTKIQFFESYSKRGSILWVTFRKGKVQFFESFWEKGSILWIIFRKRVNSLRQI